MNVMWSEPDLAGYLHKRSTRCNSWKRRLFLLQGHALFYFLNEHQVRTALPSAFIPMEGSSVEVPGGGKESSKGFIFRLLLGPEYAGLARRSMYMLAADSQEALEAWIRMIKIASYSRQSISRKLWKSRSRYREMRNVLRESPSDKELLASKGSDPTLERLQRELGASHGEKEELDKQVGEANLEADRCEAAVSHASALWDIIQVRKGMRGRSLSRPENELKNIEKLYNMLQIKGNMYQGIALENLRCDARILRKLLLDAISLIQDRHAQIRAEAPKFSFYIDPKIYDRETFHGQSRKFETENV